MASCCRAVAMVALLGSLLALVPASAAALTCDEVRASRGGAAAELATLTPTDVDACLADLGKDRLQPEQGQVLWAIFCQNYKNIEEIPGEKLRVLGWINIGITVDDIRNITLDDTDIIQAFGLYHALDMDQLSALAEQYHEYSNKQPEELSYYDLVALRQIICGFNKTDVAKIQPEAYREAAGVLATLKHCPLEVLQSLAQLAQHEEAFGPTHTWSAAEAALIGNVVQGLTDEQLKALSSVAQQAIASNLPKTQVA